MSDKKLPDREPAGSSKGGQFKSDGNGQSESSKTVEAVRKYSSDPERDISNLPSAKRLVDNYEKKFGKMKMTPEQKIKSVHIVEGQDNLLPELNDDDLAKIGAGANRPVLVKSNIIQKNNERHPDISNDMAGKLIGEALYSKDKKVARGKYLDKPYYVFYKKTEKTDKKGRPVYGTVIVDVTAQKDNFEVVHWHWVRERYMKSITPYFEQ